VNSSTTISNPTGSPRRFVCLLLGITALLLLVLGALNYWVDPYNRFGNNRLGVFISAEREAKPVLLQRYPHDALIIGDSKAAMIPAGQVNDFRFFNAAFAGASSEEEYYCIGHFAHDLKLVVLEADYLQVDPPTNKGDVFAPAGFSSIFEFLFSSKTVEYSVRTITEHMAGTPASIRPDGSSDATGWFKLYDREDKAARQWRLTQLMGMFDHMPAAPPSSFYPKIAGLLRQRKIPCVVFVPPMEQELLDHLKTDAHQKIFKQWKSDLGKNFAHVVDLSGGPYSGPENFFKTDPYHFKPDTALRLMNEQVIPVALQAVANENAPGP
jgi:hypothetical protein